MNLRGTGSVWTAGRKLKLDAKNSDGSLSRKHSIVPALPEQGVCQYWLASLAWDLSLGIICLRKFAWDISFGKFRL